jgi:hypothetical protein
MAFTWFLNSRHDLSIVGGKFRTVYREEEIKQRILVSLLHYWGEYFLNTQDGVPWYEVILGSKNRKNVELILRRAILEVPGVIGIIEFKVLSSDTIPRGLDIYVDAEVESSTGTTVMSLNIPIKYGTN